MKGVTVLARELVLKLVLASVTYSALVSAQQWDSASALSERLWVIESGTVLVPQSGLGSARESGCTYNHISHCLYGRMSSSCGCSHIECCKLESYRR